MIIDDKVVTFSKIFWNANSLLGGWFCSSTIPHSHHLSSLQIHYDGSCTWSSIGIALLGHILVRADCMTQSKGWRSKESYMYIRNLSTKKTSGHKRLQNWTCKEGTSYLPESYSMLQIMNMNIHSSTGCWNQSASLICSPSKSKETKKHNSI